MHITEKFLPDENVTIVRLKGEFDDLDCPEVREAFERALGHEGTQSVIVNAKDTRFMNSKAIAALITADRNAKANGGKMVVSGVPEGLFKTLTVLGLAKGQGSFIFAKTEDDAFDMLRE